MRFATARMEGLVSGRCSAPGSSTSTASWRSGHRCVRCALARMHAQHEPPCGHAGHVQPGACGSAPAESGGVAMQAGSSDECLQLEKMRIIMDRDGIKRLEPGSASVQTKRQRHMQLRLPGQHTA